MNLGMEPAILIEMLHGFPHCHQLMLARILKAGSRYIFPHSFQFAVQSHSTMSFDVT
jgi:hypothetical protein